MSRDDKAAKSTDEASHPLDADGHSRSSAEIEKALSNVVPAAELPGTVKRIERIFYAEHHKGPLPPSRQLAEYEKILPGLAERIVHMAEEEQKHRHHCDTSIVKAQTALPLRGQWFGVSIMVLLVACALIALLVAKSVWGAALFLTPAAIAVSTALITGQIRFASEDKDENDSDPDGEGKVSPDTDSDNKL
jgi:uncharacterized membrane protein